MPMVLSLLLSVGICPWTAVDSWWWWWWWGGWQSRIGRYRASCLSLVSPCKCFQRTWLEPASALHLQSIDDFGPELLADFQYKCLQWLTLTGDWVLPFEDYSGTIQNSNTGVEGYLTTNGNTATGSAVLEGAYDDTYYDTTYYWKRSLEVSGYFTLMNKHSRKFLTGQSSSTPNSLTIEGNDFYLL